MQTIQFSVNDNYLQIVTSILKNLKQGIIKDLTIIDSKSQANKENYSHSFFDKFQVDMSNYEFDRKEANER